jgi:DNA-binding CsgD family transcriptional regulator
MSPRAPAPDPHPGLARLSSGERAVLRLLLHGHDGKSAAVALGISLTAVHERLREARRKLDTTSSREAARLLEAAEADAEHPLAVDLEPGSDLPSADHPASGQRRMAIYGLAALVMIAILVGALCLWATGNAAP